MKVHYDRGYLSKIETGLRRPSRHVASMIDSALDAKGSLLRLYDDSGSRRNDLGTRSESPFDKIRENVHQNIDLPPELASVTAVNGDLIASAFESHLAQVRRMGQHMGPGSVFPVLSGSLHALGVLLDHAVDPSRARLLVTAAHYAEYAGWMAQEGGDEAAALYWTDRAVAMSRESGRNDMASYALIRRALIELYRGHGRSTVELARRAQADKEVPARILGLGALREGQGHALERETEAFKSCMERAHELLEDDDGHTRSLAFGTVNIANPVRMATGWSLYELGRPAEGAAILDDELGRHPTDSPRSYSRYAVRCALEYAASGQLDRACEITTDTLPRMADIVSATILADLRRLFKELDRYRADRRVRALLPELTAALRNEPSTTGRSPHA